MTDTSIYSGIAERTGGDIYIGVVGPVRTGKSTLIKKFTESLIIPNLEGDYVKDRARDEMPQSASGKTVMTTEPKFIPETAAKIDVGGAEARIKLIDCVGYIVPGAMGLFEDGQPRMVNTPWSEEAVSFSEAAETGTKKVINEHSTVGIVVTTDGSIGELSREAYVGAESKVIGELKEINKPFVVVINSTHPDSERVKELKKQLEEEHGVRVIALNCAEAGEEEISEILKGLLYEFPIRELRFIIPEWIDALGDGEELKMAVTEGIFRTADGITKVGEVANSLKDFSEEGGIFASADGIDLGSGCASVSVGAKDDVFYKILFEKSGFEIKNESDVMKTLIELSETKKKYDRVAGAIDDALNDGYGIVMPSVDDMTLEEPEIVKQAGGYGVKLKASAPSIHMMKADIKAEVSPIVGTESQSEELVEFLLKEFEEDPKKIWESNMFGKSLHELVSEGLNGKLAHMPDDARVKIANTVSRIINEGSGGLICILL